MRKKLTALCLLLAMLFGAVCPLAAAAEEEPLTLPELLGDEIRVDNERGEIYFIPQKYDIEEFLMLLEDELPWNYITASAEELLNGRYLVTGVTVEISDLFDGAERTFTLRVKGDMDGTGKTTSSEARQALRLSVGLDADRYEESFRALDVDGDNRITAADARTLLRVAVGLERFGGVELGSVGYYPESRIPLTYAALADALNNAKLEPKESVSFISLRDEPEATWDIDITNKDKEIIEAFFATLPANATNTEKIYAAYRYIQENYTYARGWDLYSQIWNKTPVEAVFKLHLAQCLQYNGAIAEVLAYMGYDVKIVEGMRGQYFGEDGVAGDYWNHYWTELYLNGETYLIEVGQPEDRWYGHFIVLYKDADGRYTYYDAEKDGYCALK